MTEVIGVILAGGLSRRMGGGDKGMLELGGKPLLVHVIQRLSPQVDNLILNANGDPIRFSRFGLPVVADGIPGFAGPLAGVLAGLDYAARRGAKSIVTAASDTPFFPHDLRAGLESAAGAQGVELALAATPEAARGLVRHPTFGLWPVRLRGDLRAALVRGLRKVVSWTDRHDAATATFSTDGGDPFFNVNTPGDMRRAEMLLARFAQ
ncbi:MAG: molybdenum cofactor guanylyltransferase MobA [Pseudomonadota bacterium]